MGVVFAVGGNQPGFDRNTNTDGDIGAEARLVPALQTVFHDGGHVRLFEGGGTMSSHRLTCGTCAKLLIMDSDFVQRKYLVVILASVVVGLAAFVGACALVYSTNWFSDEEFGDLIGSSSPCSTTVVS